MLAVDLKPPSVPYHVGLSLGQLTTWQLASSGKKSKSEREWEWVQLLVKIGCVVFRPEHRPLQRLFPSGPQRESRPPYTRLGDNQHIAASEESCSQGQGLLGIMLFCTLMSKAQRFPRSLYLRLWAKFIFRCLCWGLLMKEGGRNLEDTFPLYSVNTFLFLVSFPHTLESIKLPEPFVGDFVNSEMTPHRCLCIRIPTSAWLHGEKEKGGDFTSSSCRLLLMFSQ